MEKIDFWYCQPASDRRDITSEARNNRGDTDLLRVELLDFCGAMDIVRCVMDGACESQER